MKKLTKSICALTLIISSLSAVYQNNKQHNLSVIAIKNLVALTENENTGGNGESLTPGESTSYRYPHLAGKAKSCKLYVYMKGGVVIGTSTSDDNSFEGEVGYEKIQISGLEDSCPINKAKGCNPYSCQQVPY